MKVIFPGSFDPVTYGHLDVIQRAAHMFEELVVAVLANQQKGRLFTDHEKIEMLEELLYDYDNVTIKSFSGLLVDFVKREHADAVVRGLRTSPDFHYERQLALLNRSLAPSMETIFLITDERFSYVSSSFAREVASYGGDVSGLVPKNVERKLREKFSIAGDVLPSEQSGRI
ncbi:MAG: pantetheine-phosphate adenylyltransferase [Peptoniphilaceae bacterium]|nr:pantetheine-phosphate adenylyltransferase [Peptoniphilaceae bacterium]MDD7433590.1 pantetheine-phosphate adenylyltransferase [Peptoniphilaceae bacterium]MDY3076055.1 pantetheine-phosphate adenylyltransferase [Peptoniphilaceae bacterium]MDY3987655.1 pantetheine-phosphate adenylyltransferase [Peptoniphilaceae bacterium]MDY5841671.1 pantetheine-phosphate adenylyltransferase [Peptoniphilaceae bacterium]